MQIRVYNLRAQQFDQCFNSRRNTLFLKNQPDNSKEEKKSQNVKVADYSSTYQGIIIQYIINMVNDSAQIYFANVRLY